MCLPKSPDEEIPAPSSEAERARAGNEGPALHRHLGFIALTFYGVGDILGAGIYALVGEVAGAAGTWSWLSFLVAMCVAALSGLTYAEFARRYPRSAGAALFCHVAFRRRWLPLLVGWLVFCSGVVSMSAVSHAFARHVAELLPLVPHQAAVAVFLLIATAFSFWGIQQSSLANIVCTSIEASGLLLVIVAGTIFLAGNDPAAAPAAQVAGAAAAPGNAAAGFGALAVLNGAALAFFAFIGFEDMVNVAEEVRDPEKNYPKAILTALVIAAGLYVAVTLVATAVVPPAELAATGAPLVEVVRRAAPQVPSRLFALVALFAVANTGLLNAVMASRLLYGMSRQHLLPAWLGAVHPIRRTPHRAVLAVLAVACALAFSGTLAALAQTTSLLLLTVFTTVNAALLTLRLREGRPPEGFSVPLPVPIAGIAACLGLMAFVKRGAWVTAAALFAIGLVVIAGDWLLRRKRAAGLTP
ncbi:MAG: amino acid permease [Planctomycetes bacterium]|nr:amino acid permease [Planctomycetota bacterium]